MTRRRVLVTLGVWVALVVSLWLSNASPAVLVLCGMVAALCATAFVLIDFVADISRVEWITRRPVRIEDSVDRRVEAVRHQVRSAWWNGMDQINDTLIALVDERLLTHHSIDRSTDAAAADRALSPTLRRLVAGPRRHTAPVRELRQIVTEIEAL